MACGACAKKAAARMAAQQMEALPASTPAAVTVEPVVIQPLGNFVKKRYIGPSQRLTSVQPNLSYGMRNTGEVLVILEVDYQANLDWWEDV